MKINEAIAKRIMSLCEKRNITVNKLANLSLLTQSTLSNVVNGTSHNIKILTLIRICDGLEITVSEFFDDKIFNNIDRED